MLVFVCAGFGAAYGTAKAGVGIASMGVLRCGRTLPSLQSVTVSNVIINQHLDSMAPDF